MKATLKRNDLLYPDLSYKIMGCVFDVYRQLGPGHLEKFYQKALAIAFTKAGLKFIEQLKSEVFYEGTKQGYGKSDFLVEDKIIIEIKRGNYFNPVDFDQTKRYLIQTKLELAILVRYTPDKVLSKRVVNTNTNSAQNSAA